MKRKFRKIFKAIERDLEIAKTGKLPETPEDRFKKFLTKTEKKAKTKISKRTGISKLILFGKKVKTNDLVIFNPNGSKKIIKGDSIDKVLNQAGLTNAEKLRFKFEKDFPNKKAMKGGSPSYMFREWLVRHHLFEDYFKHGDYKDGNSI